MPDQPSVWLSREFESQCNRLPPVQRNRAQPTIKRFMESPRRSGLNYERVLGARDSRLRSIRLDGAYRMIIRAPESGNTYLFLWVDKHDEAYRWARNRVSHVHPETGTFQTFEPETEKLPVESASLAMVHQRVPSGPLGALDRGQLTRLSCPDSMVEEIGGLRDVAALDEIENRLPGELYELLGCLLEGLPYSEVLELVEAPDEPVDADNEDRALARVTSRSQFVNIHDASELQAIFDAPLEKWRVFLHPKQFSIVERDWSGPVRVLGAAGTGKTVVAMHRARWLARKEGFGRILLVTFTKNLALDILRNLQSICSEEELDRIEVVNLDAWVVDVLNRHGIEGGISYGGHAASWVSAMALRPADPALPDQFFKTEWERVVQQEGVESLEAYLSVSRAGRHRRLGRKQRAEIWKVFEEYKRQLAQNGLREREDAFRLVATLIANREIELDYASVIVDEAQDFGAPAYRLVRSIVPPAINDLFITGDTHQRIYGRRVNLAQCGIHTRGRATKLHVNYRTTRETRDWASRLIEGREYDDLNGGIGDNSVIRSLTTGPDPVIRRCASFEDQIQAIVSWLGEIEGAGEAPADVCVAVRRNAERNAIRQALEAQGVSVFVLERETDDRSVAGVRLATMHRVKGLEFDRIALASVNADQVPPRSLWERRVHPEERAIMETLERSLLYVASTRARRDVLVLSYGEPSPFLGD